MEQSAGTVRQYIRIYAASTAESDIMIAMGPFG